MNMFAFNKQLTRCNNSVPTITLRKLLFMEVDYLFDAQHCQHAEFFPHTLKAKDVISLWD